MHRKILLFAMGAIVFALTAVVAGARSVAASPPNVTTVTFATGTSSPEETALLNNVIAAFEAIHPTIDVNYETLGAQEMVERFEAGNPPDVLSVAANDAPDWIANGYLLPLHGFARSSGFDTSHFLPLLLHAFDGPGRQAYAYPKDWSPLAMFTNDSLLDQAGVTAPTTWAQLRSAAEAIKSSTSVTPICVSADWARLLAFVEENGGSFLNESRTASAINSPAARGAVEFYRGLVTDGLAAEPSTLDSGWCGQALADGKAAIVFEGNWLIPVLEAAVTPVDYSVHPMPSNVQRGNLAFIGAYSIAAASQHKRAAWELLSYLTGREGMQLWVDGGLALPARDDVTAPAGRQVFLDEAPVSTMWQFGPGFSEVSVFANAQLADVFAGNQTIDAMLSAIETAENAALAHG